MTKHNTNRLPSVIRDSCGTHIGYRRHLENKEVTCLPCRVATRVISNKRYADNPEAIKANNKKWREANLLRSREISREWSRSHQKQHNDLIKAWQVANKEHLRELAREWCKNNPEKVKAMKQRTRAKHPESSRQDSRKRRARTRQVPTEKYTTQQVLDLYGTDCHLCHKPIDLTAPRWVARTGWKEGLHLDHLIPISKGGWDVLSNMRPAHGYCNAKKHNTII